MTKPTDIEQAEAFLAANMNTAASAQALIAIAKLLAPIAAHLTNRSDA